MYHFDVGKLHYKYLVGPHTVGIITPSGQKHFRTIGEVRNTNVPVTETQPGSADRRLCADEVAAYVVKHKLL